MDPGSSLTPVVFRNAASVLWIAALKRLRSLVVYALTARAPLHRPFTPQLVFLSTDPPDPVTAQCSSWAPPHLQNRDQAPSRAVCPRLSKEERDLGEHLFSVLPVQREQLSPEKGSHLSKVLWQVCGIQKAGSKFLFFFW